MAQGRNALTRLPDYFLIGFSLSRSRVNPTHGLEVCILKSQVVSSAIKLNPLILVSQSTLYYRYEFNHVTPHEFKKALHSQVS